MTFKDFPEFVSLDHGSGGRKSDEIIDFIASMLEYRNPSAGIGVDARDDSALVKYEGTNIVTTIDGHTVDPLFFPGGDIGKLAMCGTINDIAVMGAQPLAITVSLIIEEGFETSKLKSIIQSMNEVSKQEQIPIVAGDTKVLPKGSVDKILIATSAVGVVKEKNLAQDSKLKVDDVLVLSGPIGNHGIALLSVREGLEFETNLQSDVNSMLKPIQALVKAGVIPHAMKDPTRGGISSAFNDLAVSSKKVIELEEDLIPIQAPVRAASEMLGLDVYAIANEGCFILSISENLVKKALDILREFEITKHACRVGKVVETDSDGKVLLKTTTGGTRILHKPLGKLIPRIC